MSKSKFAESHIMTILGEGKAELAVAEVCRMLGISSAIYYQGKSKSVFVNKVVRLSKQLSPFFLVTPHALAAGLTTPL
jgi:hypothetical protein